MNNPVLDKNGNQIWHNERYQFHRIDGPAIIRGDKSQFWFINDIQCYTNSSFQKAANLSDEDMIAIVLKYGNVND